MKNKFCILLFIGLLFSSMAFALTDDSLKAVTMMKYEQNWDDDHATISVRNNTENDIKNLTFRITYLDMKGNPLDYRNFSQTVSIASGMTRAIDINAFEKSRYYSYYKSESYPITPHRFKVKFELTGYNKTYEKTVGNPLADDSFFNPYGDSSSLSPYFMLIPILIIVVLLGVYVGLYILVAVMAQKRNRSVVGWILLSFIATPLLIVILLLVLGKSENLDRDFVD